ncbi:MAG: hypothetical protein NTV28_05390 [Propionibacteriales bacterium]|nr:hypothetical protein [Propionibacteriales bacterium]
MTGPLQMVGDDDAAVCVDGVCALPSTTSAPPQPEAVDGADAG